MHVTCRKDYLIQVKNAMLFHFARKEICATLKDINELFVAGMEHGKSEAELCHELGNPKDFADKFVDGDKRNRFFFNIITYISSILAICILTVYIFYSLNPIYWGMLAITVSICVWNLCGGVCLNEIFDDSSQYRCKYILYCIVSFVVVVLQQVITFLLNTWHRTANTNIFAEYIYMFYYLSILAVMISGILLVLTTYRLLNGSYLSICVLPLLVGLICSALSFITYIKAFNGPNIFSSMCSIPYISGFMLSFIVFLINNYKLEQYS